jgi:hypothetical protein
MSGIFSPGVQSGAALSGQRMRDVLPKSPTRKCGDVFRYDLQSEGQRRYPHFRVGYLRFNAGHENALRAKVDMSVHLLFASIWSIC